MLFFIPLDVVSGGKASSAKVGGKALYRAIGTMELRSIVESRKLGFKYGGVEAKYFAENVEDAIQQGVRGPDGNNFLIMSIDVPSDIYNKLFKSADIDASFMKGKTVVVSGHDELKKVNDSISEIKIIGKSGG